MMSCKTSYIDRSKMAATAILMLVTSTLNLDPSLSHFSTEELITVVTFQSGYVRNIHVKLFVRACKMFLNSEI